MQDNCQKCHTAFRYTWTQGEISEERPICAPWVIVDLERAFKAQNEHPQKIPNAVFTTFDPTTGVTLTVSWERCERGRDAYFSTTRNGNTLQSGKCMRSIEGCSRKPPCPRFIYAVQRSVGKRLDPEVYATYAEAIEQMGNEQGTRMQKFETEEDAQDFARGLLGRQVARGALPTVPIQLNGVKALADATTWHPTSTQPAKLSDSESVAYLEEMGFHWDSGPLRYDWVAGKKIVRQTKLHNRKETGIYLHCAESGISVIDIDGVTEYSLDLMGIVAGECNMVSFTNKGIHMFFQHSPALPTGFSGHLLGAGVDVRSGGKDIIYVQPSRYDCPTGRVRYTWHCVPKDKELLPCPARVVEWIRRLAGKRVIRNGLPPSFFNLDSLRGKRSSPPPTQRSTSPKMREAETRETSQHSEHETGEYREARSQSDHERIPNQQREAMTPPGRTSQSPQSLPQDLDEHLWHYGTATAAEWNTRALRSLYANIFALTLNIGGHQHIMDEKGHPNALFEQLIGTLGKPSAIALTDVQLTPRYPNKQHMNVWRTFCARMKELGYVAHGICGPNGVALFSSGITHYAVPPPDQSQDAIELHVRRIKPKDPTARFIFRAVYFPHDPKDTHHVYPTLARMQTLAALKQNISLTTGDTNAENANKRTYGHRMIMAKHVRILTPFTGKPTKGKDGTLVGGGRAQAIWTTHPAVVVPDSPRSLEGYAALSNHHQPLVYEISLSKVTENDAPAMANLRSQMRILKKGMTPSAAADVMTQAAEIGGISALQQAMIDITEIPLQRHDKRRAEYIDNLTDSERQNRRRAHIMGRAEQMTHKVNKAVLQAAIKNSPSLKANVLNKENTPLPDVAHMSARYAKILEKLSWVKIPCNLEEYFAEVSEVYAQVDAATKQGLEARYTEEEVREAREFLKHNKTYCDFEARIAHLMGPTALEEIAKLFSIWQLEVSLEVLRKILGVPTNKRHTETNPDKILHKLLRPIGLAELLRAWFSICQNRRLLKILKIVAPDRMFCSVPNREGHDMIMSLLSMVKLAGSHHPVWMLQGDISKCWDFLQHAGISHLDKMLGMSTPIFHTMAEQFRRTLIDVYATEGKPARAHQEAGGTQGSQTVPTLAMLILTPLMIKLRRHAEGTAEGKAEIVKSLRDVFNFADDFFVTSDDLPDAVERFILAQYLCHLVGWTLNLVAVACNARATVFSNSLNRTLPYDVTLHGDALTIGNTTCKIESTVRPLQGCVHLRNEHEPCAHTRCKACPLPHTEKLHETCRERIIGNLAAQPLPIVDKAQFANQNLVASLMYAAYSCPRQAAALFALETEIRWAIFGHGHGGYIEGAHLAAPTGGLGLADSIRLLAIETASTLERAISRQGVASRLLIAARRTGEWPLPIQSALRGKLPKERAHKTIQPSLPFATFDLHRDLLENQPPRCNTMIAFKMREEQVSKKLFLVKILAVAWATDHDAQDVIYTVQRKGVHLTMIKMRLLAQIIEREALKGCAVSLAHNLPEDMLIRVEQIKNEHRAMHHEGRVFESVVTRTCAKLGHFKLLPEVTDTTCFVEDDLIPESYPISAKVAGLTYVTGSLRDNSIKKLKQIQEREYREQNQIKKILYPPEHAQRVNLEYSAASAGTLHGVHYDSELTFTQSNKIVRLKTGTELKEEGEHVHCAQCPNNVKVSLNHVAWHVSEETLHEVADLIEKDGPKCNTCGTPKCMCKGTGLKFGPLNRNHLHPSMVFGFLHHDLLKAPTQLSDHKEHMKYMKKISATFALLGIAEYKKCNPKSVPDLTPDTLPPQLAKDESKKYKYQAYADASVEETTEGPWVIGLGGFIQEGDGNVIEYFAIRKEVPRGTSATHAEHFASLLLAKLVLHIRLQNVCFLADNNAVPNQIDGLWCTKGLLISSIREKTHHLLARIGHGYLWTSRVYNQIADALANQAVKGQVTHHDFALEEEIDEILAWAGASVET